MWFPGIDKFVEDTVKFCIQCRASHPGHNPREPLQPTPLPLEPWSTPGIDFAGSFPSGDYFLVVIDEYSRFPEVVWHTIQKITLLSPEANGEVERFMATHSKNIRSCIAEGNLYGRFLRMYRDTPHTSTKISLFEALTGRKMKVDPLILTPTHTITQTKNFWKWLHQQTEDAWIYWKGKKNLPLNTSTWQFCSSQAKPKKTFSTFPYRITKKKAA